MILSVVICTYNRAELLERALNSLLNSPREASESWELLVIDNNSTDMTKEVVSSYEARYILEPNQGIAYARNRGYMEAKGTYVAYIDDDAYVDSGWLD
jgi:glycosyltransferase involved in cell wall biosynthesis